jgi:hypothetical protein
MLAEYDYRVRKALMQRHKIIHEWQAAYPALGRDPMEFIS